MSSRSAATAGILPEGSVAPVASLADGEYKLKILDVWHNNEMEIEYPDGWHRTHQARDMVELGPKLVRNLRTRYGVEEVRITDAPMTLAVDTFITVEVANGK